MIKNMIMKERDNYEKKSIMCLIGSKYGCVFCNRLWIGRGQGSVGNAVVSGRVNGINSFHGCVIVCPGVPGEGHPIG